MPRFILFLFISCCLWDTSQAFYENPSVTRDLLHYEIEILDDQNIQISMVQKLTNTTTSSTSVQSYLPLPASAKSIQHYVDARSEVFEVFTGTDRVDAIFPVAEQNQNAAFFRLLTPPYTQVLRTRELELPPQQTISLKWKWTQTVDFVNDFFFSEVFTDDGIASRNFKVDFTLISQKPIYHYFTNLSAGGMLERGERQAVMLYQQKDYTLSENLRFFWSHREDPTLMYSSKGEIYHGHFISKKTGKDLQEVIVLVDVSGSMSGNPWIRTQEYMNFVLEKLLDTKKIKIGLVDSNFRWYNPDWQTNDHQYRKGFFEFLKTLRPLGDTNFELALEETLASWTLPVEQRGLFFITDYADPAALDLDVSQAPLVVLNFSENDQNPLQVLTHESGGWFQRLFRTPPKLIEADEIIDKWQRWSESVEGSSVQRAEGEQDLLPQKLAANASPVSPLFIGRSFSPYAPPHAKAALFLPRVWGARQIVSLLQKTERSDEDLQAILSIAKRFGIRNSFLEPEMRLVELGDRLQTIDPSSLRWEIMQLENAANFFPNWGGRFFREIPLYYSETDQIWRSYDFFERAQRDTLIEIAPFSQAQYQLLRLFPEILAEGFGAGEQVEFCPPFRCLSVQKNARAEPAVTDRMFFRDFDPLHWANPYLAQLIDRGVLTAEKNGKIHPNREIDRGTFALMLYRSLDEKPVYEGLQQFLDVAPESEFYQAVHWLYSQGTIRGYSDGTFRPFQSLTRAEGVKILLSLQGFNPDNQSLLGQSQNKPVFADATGWEQPWVEAAYNQNLIQGFTDQTFRPHIYLTRAQAAKLIVESGR